MNSLDPSLSHIWNFGGILYAAGRVLRRAGAGC
jgi:hypothetical protein